jgi:hypothetical protein
VRKIKHFSMCQNRPVFYDSLKEFEGMVMLSMDVPRYFHFTNPHPTKEENEYEKRMLNCTLYVTLTKPLDAKAVASMFDAYGDINVISLVR